MVDGCSLFVLFAQGFLPKGEWFSGLDSCRAGVFSQVVRVAYNHQRERWEQLVDFLQKKELDAEQAT